MGADAGGEPPAAVAGAALTRPEQTRVETGGERSRCEPSRHALARADRVGGRQQRLGVGSLWGWKARPARCPKAARAPSCCPAGPIAPRLRCGSSAPAKDMVAAETGLAAFCDRLWLWVAETGSLPAAFCEGDGVRACQAPDLIAWLAGRRRAAVTAQPGRRAAHLACGLRPCPRAMPLSLACALQFRDPQT